MQVRSTAVSELWLKSNFAVNQFSAPNILASEQGSSEDASLIDEEDRTKSE